MIHPTTLLYHATDVAIGKQVDIGPFCLIGFHPEKIMCEKNFGVAIGDLTKLTGLVSVDGGAERQTVIGVNCYIMKHVHIGHDAHIGDRVIMSPGACIGGGAEVMDYAVIGMGAKVHQLCKVPQGTMLGMNCVVTKKNELVPFGCYVGAPARFLRWNEKAIAEYEDLAKVLIGDKWDRG